MSIKNYQAIVIGAGPIGIATSIALQKSNISHVVLEKGCIVDSIFHYPTNMTFFSTSERLEIGGIPFISHGTKPTRREALEYYRRVVTAFKLPIQTYERVESVESNADSNQDFKIRTSKASYSCSNLILSTGFYGRAHRMEVSGEDLPKVKHYYDEPHPYALQKVAVIGGGNSAVDAALETYRCNAKVTMIIRDQALKDGVKYWVRPDIENRINEGAIEAYFGAEVLEIDDRYIVIQTSDGRKLKKENDFVLAMTGYEPYYGFLEKLGVRLVEGDSRVPEYDVNTQETNVEGLYLAGVICGGMKTNRWFIENTRDHGDKIAKHIVQKYPIDI